MDPAELGSLKEAVQHQGAAIGRHEQLLLDITQQFALVIQKQASNLDTVQPTQPTPSPPPIPEVAVAGHDAQVATPERYSGESDKCRGFLLQCSLVFEQQPSRFPTERSRVSFMVSLLTDRALAWATALWEQNSPECATVQAFTKALCQTFYQPLGGKEAGPRLLELTQGARSVAEYTIEFRTLAAESAWGEEALTAL